MIYWLLIYFLVPIHLNTWWNRRKSAENRSSSSSWTFDLGSAHVKRGLSCRDGIRRLVRRNKYRENRMNNNPLLAVCFRHIRELFDSMRLWRGAFERCAEIRRQFFNRPDPNLPTYPRIPPRRPRRGYRRGGEAVLGDFKQNNRADIVNHIPRSKYRGH